jgi:hypothetical protein
MKDHDRLFKELIGTFFLEFLDLFFPEVRAYVETGSIEFLDKEIFTDVTSGERLEPDLVAKVRFKASPTFFIIHVENQAQPQASFSRRLFRYFSRLYDKYDLPVYPIVVFSFDSPRESQADFHLVSFPNKVVMEFRYDVIQLNRLNWRDFLDKHSPVAAAMMAKMSIAPADRVRVKLECLRLLATLRLNRAKMRLISGFVDAYLNLSLSEQKEFEANVATLAAHETEAVMEIVTSWMKEGLKQGRREGRAEGRRQGRAEGRRQGRAEGRRQGLEEGQLRTARDDVLNILEARFKKVPARVKKALSTVDDRKTLKLLLRQAVTAVNLKDFEQRLSRSA